LAKDLNGLVAKYRGQVEEVARDVRRTRRARRVGAEMDDLMQEGLISVWQQLGRGQPVSMGVVKNRMRDWVRLLARQTGNSIPAPGRAQHIPYDQLLPMDDYRASGDS
jgi:DNA-directed RNA polymerase specialized sigma24 family protein